ncbi:MAG: hypothetical protein Rubg2KO_38260 [Rubricoccaceae bacterium]
MNVCPVCDTEYADHVRFCAKDGAALVASATETPPPPRPAPPPVAPVSPPVAPASPPAPPKRSRRTAIIAGVLVLALAGIAAGAYVLQGARQLERQAIGALSRGDLVTPPRVSAYDYYQRLLDRHPRSAGVTRVADAALGPVIEAMDGFYEDWYTTSEADAGAWTRIERLGEWAVELAPDDPHVRARRAYAQARLAVQSEDTEAAREAYGEAIRAWPDWALPYNSLGVLEAQADNPQAAEAQYRDAIARDPNWVFPQSNLGGLLLRQRKYVAAQRALRQAVLTDPDRAITYVLLARASAGREDYDAAVEAAENALRLDGTGTSGFDAARLKRDAEEWTVHGWYDGIE